MPFGWPSPASPPLFHPYLLCLSDQPHEWVFHSFQRGRSIQNRRAPIPPGFHDAPCVPILKRVGDPLVRSSCGTRLRGHQLYSVSLGPPHRPVIVHYGQNLPDPVHFCVRVPLSGHSSASAHRFPIIQHHRQDLCCGPPQFYRSACAVKFVLLLSVAVARSQQKKKKKLRKRRTARKNKAENRLFRPQKPPKKIFYAAVWRGRKI